ncbi:hypothetical protein T01_14331 [Trichinella spiralis]|uniref:Uncharacterized protein n=1 Tax=Trichinella spiralis TaxID=6334 RepID=A0A0V1B2E9_TRISP|nr:hypothetical protein T01_8592 [Trichinella spiralis]KRY31220.1 hypothetical protein T01_14331 [Trichinella spiralis]
MNFDHMTSVPMSFEYATFIPIFWTRCLRACWAALLELASMQKLTKGFCWGRGAFRFVCRQISRALKFEISNLKFLSFFSACLIFNLVNRKANNNRPSSSSSSPFTLLTTCLPICIANFFF